MGALIIGIGVSGNSKIQTKLHKNDVQSVEYKRNCTDTNEIVVITPSEKMEQLVSNPQIKLHKWDRSKILGQIYRGLNGQTKKNTQMK